METLKKVQLPGLPPEREQICQLFDSLETNSLATLSRERQLALTASAADWLASEGAKEGRFSDSVRVMDDAIENRENRYHSFRVREDSIIRRFRGYYYDADRDAMAGLTADRHYWLNESTLSYVFVRYDKDRYHALTLVIGSKFLSDAYVRFIWDLKDLSGAKAIYNHASNPEEMVRLAQAHLMAGESKPAAKIASCLLVTSRKAIRLYGHLLSGWIAWIKGDHDEALTHFREAASSKTRGWNIHTITELVYASHLASSGTGESKARLKALKSKASNEPIGYALDTLQHADRGAESPDTFFKHPRFTSRSREAPLLRLFHYLSWYWAGLRTLKSEAMQRNLLELAADAKIHGAYWAASVAIDLANKLLPKSTLESHALLLESVDSHCDFQPVSILTETAPEAPWEKQLVALEELAWSSKSAKKAVKESPKRLAWIVTVAERSYGMVFDVELREQSEIKKGGWSKGKPVSWKRLKTESGKIKALTEDDQKLAQAIHLDRWRQAYHIDDLQAIYLLAGHPLVFDGASGAPLEIVRQDVTLILEEDESAQSVQIRCQPEIDLSKLHRDYIVTQQGPSRLTITHVSERHLRLLRIFELDTGNQTTFPAAGKERLLAALERLRGDVHVFSGVEGDQGNGFAGVTVVAARSTPHLHLSPSGSGLRIAMVIEPLADVEAVMPPGSGSQIVVGEIEGKPVQTKRNFTEERARCQEVIQACPSLKVNVEGQAFQWDLAEPEDCLELLTELHELGEGVIIKWPHEERFRIRHQATIGSLRLKIRSAEEWFAVSGDLEINEGEVLTLKKLLELLEKDALGRFVKLSDGQFLALTKEFRQRLDELRDYTNEGRGADLKIHPVAAHALEDLASEAETSSTPKWKRHLKKLRELEQFQAALPTTLQAELRPYQHEGFQWLARLAHWGVGACLADDMGLGKTVQTLALLLTRASDGPAIVVAPTSVTRNWIREIQRFTPTLRPHLFGPGDRQEMIDWLGPFDVLLCTYGLLPNEIDKLHTVTWNTIVLDEAQIIKNSLTKRSKAAMKLKGGFRIITTGTPVENDLSELYTLFQFLNPGLLGSRQRFHVRFADPIQKREDFRARNRLKKLITPFILRRLKQQVLEDLPPRTDIVLSVEMSPEEVTFYEALRRQAVESLTQKENDDSAGERSLRILAEITRLRRACCHPKLIEPQAAPASSKLTLFAETLENILTNQHKALVFSQFVDHLAILREHLEQQGVHYLYLDGQTPAKQRQERVDAFQAGKADVFLISLRAGGTGLNLTAADYVIHMDPWWNPAVEDQASDRAHRIGQRRPVTVYRLVTRNTIEEKIVELHAKKRDLADSLLSGTDAGARLTPEQMLALLKDE